MERRAVSAAPQSALQWQRLRSSRLDAAGVTISGTYDPADTGASGHSVRHLREGGATAGRIRMDYC